ncbi:hypothetical protein D6L37_08910 [Vibrio parahaemolyticus]|nr:hypothetical protein [Vibrio parahaemolyticus]
MREWHDYENQTISDDCICSVGGFELVRKAEKRLPFRKPYVVMT